MSISSLAEDSALRLAGATRPAIPIEEVVTRAAASTKDAVDKGLSADDAATQVSRSAIPSEVDAVLTQAANSARDAIARGLSADEAAEHVTTEARAAIPAVPTSNAVESSRLSQLIKYVPSETIILYLAVVAALGELTAPTGKTIADADFSVLWILTIVFFVLTALLTCGLSYRSQKSKGTASFTVPVFEILASSAAFLVWALSLPSSPLRDFTWYNDAWSSVIILGGTIIIGVLAYVVGATVSWQKVVDAS